MHRVMPLAAVFCFVISARAQGPSAPSQNNWSPAQLDRVFDGKALRPELSANPVSGAPAQKRILYPEADPPPAAPRFALDLSAVPEEFRHTIRGYDRLYHKNQEETKEQVDKTNALIRRCYTKRRAQAKRGSYNSEHAYQVTPALVVVHRWGYFAGVRSVGTGHGGAGSCDEYSGRSRPVSGRALDSFTQNELAMAAKRPATGPVGRC